MFRKKITPGFTLIEMLVVIAIIGLLAAIVFPVFSRVRENARRSSCQSNLKQIGLGIIQYAQDYDEIVVPSRTMATNSTWPALIYPYVKNLKVFVCPSNRSKSIYVSTDVEGTTANDISNDYMANGTSVQGAGGTAEFGAYPGNVATVGWKRPMAASTSTALITTKLAEFTEPPRTLLIHEYYCGPSDVCDKFGNPTPRTDCESWGLGDMLLQGHLGTTNFLFADGHVKALLPTETIRDSNMWSVTPTSAASIASISTTTVGGRTLAGQMAIQEARLQ